MDNVSDHCVVVDILNPAFFGRSQKSPTIVAQTIFRELFHSCCASCIHSVYNAVQIVGSGWNPEEMEEVREAEARFNELVEKGRHTAFDIVEGGQSKQLKKFDPDANKIVVVPRLAGG